MVYPYICTDVWYHMYACKCIGSIMCVHIYTYGYMLVFGSAANGSLGSQQVTPFTPCTLKSFAKPLSKGRLRAGGERKLEAVITLLSQNGHTFAKG